MRMKQWQIMLTLVAGVVVSYLIANWDFVGDASATPNKQAVNQAIELAAKESSASVEPIKQSNELEQLYAIFLPTT